MPPALRLVACLFALGVMSADGSAQAPAPVPLPTVTWFVAPKLPQVFEQAKLSGSLKVLISTDGRRVTDVRDLPADRQESKLHWWLTGSVAEAVRQWQFAPHAPTSFELTFSAASRSGPNPCRDVNARIRAHLPRDVSIEYPPSCIIDVSNSMAKGTLTVRHLAGVVERVDGRAAKRVTVSIESGELRDSMISDAGGTFDFGPKPPGRYRVTVYQSGCRQRTYDVVVRQNVSSHVKTKLTVDECEPGYQPSPPTVLDSELPLYPAAMREAGVAGDVLIHVGGDGDKFTTVTGPAGLVAAAIANLKTWKWDKVPEEGVLVTYRYQLLPGDCTGDNGPFVATRQPFEVDVAMKRIVPCGSSPKVRSSKFDV